MGVGGTLFIILNFQSKTRWIVTMTLTAPDVRLPTRSCRRCMMSCTIDGIDEATVNLTFEPMWTPERMSETARLELGFDI